MNVFKFGGASVKDAEGIRNVTQILKKFQGLPLLIVVSAMGKMTNALEQVVNAYFFKTSDAFAKLKKVRDYHETIIKELFPNAANPVHDKVNNFFVELEWAIEGEPTGTYDFEYDQIVSMGEFISSTILSEYLITQGLSSQWLDVRDYIKTDNTYREGKINWEQTQSCIQKLDGKKSFYLTQGFVGVTSENFNVTLGREGSDYTASVFAYCLDAEKVVIWKDVPGVLSADPKWKKDAVRLSHISYHEAIELTYFGATVIHPKTMQPLQSKGIVLEVRSFLKPDEKGTIVDADYSSDAAVPSFILKKNQILISITPRDFSFIVEENLSHIFGLFAKHRVKVNLMQNAALSFSVCADDDEMKTNPMMEDLREKYKVLHNRDVELLTIRHYTEDSIEQESKGKEILVIQKSRQTARMVLRANNGIK